MTFIIDIDAAEYADDATATDALAAFAAAAGVTFTNIRPADVLDRAFGEYVAFDATDADVAAYLAFYDADDDAIDVLPD
jgi:hypothetical protein